MIVSLAQLKAHLNVIDDADDQLLEQKLETAHAAIRTYIGADIFDDYSEYVPAVLDEETGEIETPAVESDAPAPIREALLRFAGHLYDYRDDVSGFEGRSTTPPLTVFDLVAPYRQWNF